MSPTEVVMSICRALGVAMLATVITLPAILALLGDRAHTGPTWLPRLHH